MSGAKKVTLYKSVNETIIFYFERTNLKDPKSKMYWQLMPIDRMEEIFKYCLRCPQISTYSENKIYHWFKKYRNIEIKEKTTYMLKK